MKKIFSVLLSIITFGSAFAQTQVAIGPQSASFTSWVRGYHFTAPVNFTICGIYVAPDMSTAAQNCAIVRFTAGAPPAFPGTTNSFVNLFQNQNYVPNTMISCNVPVTAGDIIGVYGSRGNTCINSYDGANYATTIMGFPTTLQRSGMQNCLQAVGMQNIWSEVANPCGRVFIYYNCCTTPSVTASATPTSVCPGTQVALLGGGASTYTWNPGNIVGAAVNVTPAATTNYTVAGTSTAGCTSTATVAVTVNPNPTVTAVSNPTTICSGQTSNLTGGGASTYTWQPGNIVGSVVTVTPAATTVYTVTGSSASGCTNTKTTQVTVNALPVVNPNSNSPVCLGGNINLTVGAFTTYTWTGPNSFSSNLQNPTLTNATAAMAGVYTVSVTNASGCVSGNTVSVVVNPLPVITPTNTGPYCAGQTINLSTAAASTYTWSGPNAFSSNSQNPSIPNAQPINSGTYSVSVTGAGGCISSGTTAVTVNALPVPVANNTGPYCPGNTIQLSTGAFSTYTWTGPSAFNSNIQNATQSNAQTTNSGVYTVTVTDANGCINTATTNVVVNPSPIPNAGSNSPVCLGFPINLTSNPGGGSYSWSGPNAFTSNIQNPSIAAATAANAGVYSLTVTTLGCSAVGTITVTVTTPTVAAANAGPFCAGTTMSLSSTAASSYTWTGPAGFTSNSQNPTQANITVGATGTYSLLVSIGSCTASSTTNVLVNALPVPVANNTGPYCPGNTIQLSTGAFSTYTWTGPSSFNSNIQNATQSNAQTTNSGVYTVAVTDANGCTNTATTNVVVNPSPIPNAGSNSPVCLGFPLNLTSNPGGGAYSWSGPNSFSSNVQNPTIGATTSANAGVYTLTVTTLGCSAVGSVTVNITTPTVVAGNAGPFCAGTTMSLTSTSASSFTWSGPAGFTSSSQNPTQANVALTATGTYTVLVSIGTCTASSTTNVLINALPTPSAQSNSPVCAGQTINLTGSGGTTYTWSGPGSYSSNAASPNITNATTSQTGNYILTVTDNNGCTNTANTNVLVNPLPVIAVNNPTNCVNTTINLTANGAVTYTWSGPNSFASNAQNPNIPAAQLNMSGVYVVTATDANGCVNTANANVSVLPLPSPAIVANSPICAGGTLNLQGSGGASYSWSGPGYTGSNQNPTINTISAAAAGVYTLLVSSGSCTASTTYSVVVNPVPVFNFSNNNVLCNSQSNGTSTVNVTVGTSPYNYQWSNSQNTQVATNLAAGTYTCIVTDANNCTSVASTQITQPTTFTVSVNSATTSACANTPINVTANGSGGTGPYTYTWVAGPTASLYSVNESAAGNYVYTVNATDANGCASTNYMNLTFYPQPTVTATSATICIGQTANLTANGATSYTWQPGNVVGANYPYQGNTSVNVTVIGSMNGCSNSANTNIMVFPNPNASISSSTNKNCAPSCVTFTANSTSSITSYGWSVNGVGITGAQNASYCFPDADTYTLNLTVIDGNGCTANAAPLQISLDPNPVADFNFAPLKPIVNLDQEVTFTDASHSASITAWNWYFMNTAQYTSTLQNPTFVYTEPGTYAVALVVKTDKGCMDTLVREIVVGEDFGIYVPNAFTPNGDGLNDVFQPKGFGITKYQLYIYDRWGELMFQTSSFEEGWNGAKQKKVDVSYPLIIEEGTYSWLIQCTSVFGKSHEMKGHVVLIK